MMGREARCDPLLAGGQALAPGLIDVSGCDPLLAVGLIVGLSVSIVQAVTQIQEQTLSFIPKILAVVGTLLLLMPWMLAVIVEYTRGLLLRLPENF